MNDIERGFIYDRLTKADDEHVEAVRDRLYAAPCGRGVWVSVKDGMIVHGHGGNEREQWTWQKSGPWIKLDEQKVEWSEFGRVRQERDSAQGTLAALRAQILALGASTDSCEPTDPHPSHGSGIR